MTERAQKFGGFWSLLKVEAVEKYLQAYVQAMSKQSFDLVYIDTFAGSGSFSYGEAMPLMGEDEATRIFAGSVKRALAISAFKEYYFIEANPKNVASLEALVGTDARVRIIAGDANVELAKLATSLNWARRRGVVFVDPYGPEADWSILRAIAGTKALDMFLLFPLAAVYRNAPHDHGMLTPEKRAMVTKCLDNSPNWEAAFYSTSRAVVRDLFEDAPMRRHVDIDAIETFVTDLLKVIFPHVEKPARLFGNKNAPLFDLYFAVANPSPAAIRVASPIARHLLKAI